jgi:hypothetical protein
MTGICTPCLFCGLKLAQSLGVVIRFFAFLLQWNKIFRLTSLGQILLLAASRLCTSRTGRDAFASGGNHLFLVVLEPQFDMHGADCPPFSPSGFPSFSEAFMNARDQRHFARFPK